MNGFLIFREYYLLIHAYEDFQELTKKRHDSDSKKINDLEIRLARTTKTL